MEDNREIPSDAKTVNYQRSLTLESALSITKFGLFNCILITIAGTILTAFLLETLGISYVIAVAECDLDLSSEEKGILSAVAFIGVIISAHLWGFLADTKGRKKVIVPTLFLAFAVTVVSSFTTNFWSITACRFIVGFFISASSATIYPYLSEFHNRQNGARAIMGASFVFGIGCLLLPVIAFTVINQEWEFWIPLLNISYRPWRLFIVVCGLPSLISALALLSIPESPKFMFNQGKADEATQTIEWMHHINASRKELPLKIECIIGDTEAQQAKDRRKELSSTKGFGALLKLVWHQTAPLFMAPYLRKTIIVCILQFGTYLTSHGLYMFFPGILNQVMEAHEVGQVNTVCEIVSGSGNKTANDYSERECRLTLDTGTYQMSFILEVIYAFGFAFIGMVLNIIGRLPILLFVFTCCGLAGVLMLFINIPLAAAWLYMVLLMAGFAGSVVSSITVDLFPTNLRAMAVCISLMFGRLGSVVGANMLGLLLENYCGWTFCISGGLLLGCAMLSFFIPNIYRRQQPDMRESISSR